MNQFLVAGMVNSDWAEAATVVHPFRLGDVVLRCPKKAPRFHIDRKRHLLETALVWKEQMAAS
jgi:hypothetical protein